jgi:hypothetical protein
MQYFINTSIASTVNEFILFLYSVIVKALDYFSTALEINFLDIDGFNNQVKNF